MEKKNLRRAAYLSVGILLLGVFIFASRGPHISNALKKIILPELENATGRKVIAQKIYLNIFPLFIEIKGLKVFDDEGDKILTVERAKGYVGLSGIFRKELILKRLVIKAPEAWTDKNQANYIIDKFKAYMSVEDKRKIKVTVNAVEVRDAGFSFYDGGNNTVLAGSGLDGEAILGEIPRLKAHINEFVLRVKDFPELKAEVDCSLAFKKEEIDIKKLNFKVDGSGLQSAGSYSFDGKGAFNAEIGLVVESVKKVFGLKQSGEGKISAKGDIRFEDGVPLLNMKVKGDFYLQTLMELLKVHVKEKIDGWVDFDGRLAGKISDLKGTADARLRKGSLFNVEIDDLRCKVFYEDGLLAFKNGKGLLYNGHGEAEASLKLPHVDHFTVKVKYADADSIGAFKLIRWDPGVPKGKVSGELYSSGAAFDPSGWFDYENKKTGENLFGRIKKIKGKFSTQGTILSLSDLEVRTERSMLGINGAVDIATSALDLKGVLQTVDLKDLTIPYFGNLHGSGDFTGTITGKFDDPVLTGKLKVISASYDGYDLEGISGELSYKKNILEIKELSAGSRDERYGIKGIIRFDMARDLFDFRHPDYALSAFIKNADIEKLSGIFYKKLHLKGRVDSDMKIAGLGPRPGISGSATIRKVEGYKLELDSASMGFNYNFKDFAIKKAVLKRNDSSLLFEGNINEKKQFSFEASSARIFMSDLGLKGMPADSVLSLNAEGQGTFDNPVISLNGRLAGGTFKGKSLGDGTIKASIKNKEVKISAILFNEKVRLTGKAHLDDVMPWSAALEISPGRYDFLLSTVLKDIPEDILFNLKAKAELSGDRNHFYASALIDQLNVALFGYGFSNDSDIKIRFDNRNMSFSSFTMRSGNASFSLKGNMEIGREYNLVLEGSSALSPLKGFSKMISVLRGDADFTLAVSGNWDAPQISGSMNIVNGSFGLKDVHQRISSINGYFYFEGDKVVIQRVSGKIGGGDIEASGLIYLKGFNIKRFYLDAKLNNITTAISKDFTANFDGDIFYKGTIDSQIITGEVKINRARYRERVEWKSWLLKARAKEKPKLEPTRLEKAGLNIKIYGADNILLDNNIARAPLKVDMMLRGTIGHPLLFGRVESRGGKVYFRNNEFNILSASADFADPNRINPLMEIVAQTIVKGYNIKMSLEGQLEHFNLSLVSDPHLEETDILSLLTVGQIGKELKGLEGGIGAGEAASFLTGKVQDVFEDRLKNITGLDRVQVDPYVSKSTGTVGPRVTVSKRLLGDRLFVTYISSVGSTEEQVLKLEYILGKNVSLLGVRDEKGSMGGDIKFRFEFK